MSIHDKINVSKPTISITKAMAEYFTEGVSDEFVAMNQTIKM
jgi:hypothetical protein